MKKINKKKLIKNLKNLGFLDKESFIIYDEQKDSKEFFNEYIDNRQKRLNVGKKGKKLFINPTPISIEQNKLLTIY